MKNRILLLIALFISTVSWAQQPFERYGYAVEISSLSEGKYVEDFTSDSLVQVGSVMLNRVTGKIVSFITYDTLYSEATLDPQLVSRWMSPDPLAEQYYDHSPYNFVLNNPIRYVDPDGTEVWISYGEDRRVRYDNGQLFNEDGSDYDGDDAFVSSVFDHLNSINGVEIGAEVLGDLVSSENIFEFANVVPEKGFMSFDVNDNGKGGTFNVGNISNENVDEGFRFEATAHELFHGFQTENGALGASINKEVGAQLFGRAVAFDAGKSSNFVFGNNTPAGQSFNNAMLNLIGSDQFSERDFINAAVNFKGGSINNSSGVYNKFRIRGSTENPTIKRLFPLIRKF